MGPYWIEYRPEVHKDLDPVPRNIQKRIKKAIEQRLGTSPAQYGERLRRSLRGFWKLRVGDYRIVYELKETHITLWLIAHRKNVYEEMEKRRAYG